MGAKGDALVPKPSLSPGHGSRRNGPRELSLPRAASTHCTDTCLQLSGPSSCLRLAAPCTGAPPFILLRRRPPVRPILALAHRLAIHGHPARPRQAPFAAAPAAVCTTQALPFTVAPELVHLFDMVSLSCEPPSGTGASGAGLASYSSRTPAESWP
jgi:hypothetical protein